jgi:hypothetical protein
MPYFLSTLVIFRCRIFPSVSAKISYKILGGCCCHIIILNVHTPTEDKIDDVKDSFYEELERVFDNFPKHHMKILLGDFNAEEDNNWG